MRNDTRFSLQAHIDALYTTKPRRLTVRTESEAAFGAWQREFRQAVAQILGIAGRMLPQSIPAEKLSSVQRAGYTEEKYALQTAELDIPVYILVPDGEPPFKPVLLFHGHNPQPEYVLGHYPDEATAAEYLAIDNNYAQVLAQTGYLVCVVVQRGFGERYTDNPHIPESDWACRDLSFEYLLHGRTMAGERVWDGMNALTYLQSRSDVVPDALACTGHSGGGTTTLWLSALDERVTVVVPSCYFCSFKLSILGVRHCECNYVPGILQLGEMGDLAALIAPRPLRVIAGEQDHIFPLAGVQEQWQTVEAAYNLLGQGERCSLTVHPGGHAYNIPMSREWLAAWL